MAVMSARLASGRMIQPHLLSGRNSRGAAALPVSPEHLRIVREAMWAVVNGGGTGGASRMQVPGVSLAAKTGTAQVRRITMAERRSGVLSNGQLPFKLRDHAHFVCFAPADNPRYAASVVLEHNGHTVRNLDTPLTGRDIMTYLFDRERALKSLAEVEPTWGGDIRTRMAAQKVAFDAAQNPVAAPPEDTEAAASNVVEAATEASDAATPTTGIAEGRTRELPLEDDTPGPQPTGGNTL